MRDKNLQAKFHEISEFEKPTPNAAEYEQDYEGRKLIWMEDTDWYKNDALGLKTLEEDGRILKLHMEGGHD